MRALRRRAGRNLSPRRGALSGGEASPPAPRSSSRRVGSDREQQIHVLCAPLPLRLFIEADIYVVHWERCRLHAEHVFNVPVPQPPVTLYMPRSATRITSHIFHCAPSFYIVSAQEQQPEHERDNKYRRYRADNIHRAQQYAERQPHSRHTPSRRGRLPRCCSISTMR